VEVVERKESPSFRSNNRGENLIGDSSSLLLIILLQWYLVGVFRRGEEVGDVLRFFRWLSSFISWLYFHFTLHCIVIAVCYIIAIHSMHMGWGCARDEAGLRDETLGLGVRLRSEGFFCPQRTPSTHQHARGYEGISIYLQSSPLNLVHAWMIHQVPSFSLVLLRPRW
jgi:hypothetical protein